MKLQKKTLGPALVVLGVLVVGVGSMVGCVAPIPMTTERAVVPDHVFAGESIQRGGVKFALIPAIVGKIGNSYRVQAEERAKVFADIRSVLIEFSVTPNGASKYQYLTNTVRDGAAYTFAGMSAPDALYVRVTFYDQANGLGGVINKNSLPTVSEATFPIIDQQVTAITMPIALRDGRIANADASMQLGIIEGGETGLGFVGADPIDPTPPPAAPINWGSFALGVLDPMIELGNVSWTAGNTLEADYMVPQSWMGNQLSVWLVRDNGEVVSSGVPWIYQGNLSEHYSQAYPVQPNGTYWMMLQNETSARYNYVPFVIAN